MLVAPVTSPGNVVNTTVWIPPGRWVDYFTGATFTGPMTITMAVPLSRMPVFVRAGGVVPEQSPSADSRGSITAHMTIQAFSGSGADGSFNVYADSGTGLGYTKGQYTNTMITYSVGSDGGTGTDTIARVTVGRARGHYSGEPAGEQYHIEMVDLSRPSQVTLNGQPGVVIEASGEVTTALVLDVIDGQVSGVRVVTNPEKLGAVRGHGVSVDEEVR